MTFDRVPQTLQTQVSSAVTTIKNSLASVGVQVPVQTATSYTVTDAARDIMVTVADAVTITITAGLPIGTEVRVMRTVASANAITVARSGSETIEGGTTFETHGAQAASTGNYAEVVLKKISATAWMFVRGEVSGSNSNGSWIKYGDGTMECWNILAPVAIGAPAYLVIRANYAAQFISATRLVPTASIAPSSTNAGVQLVAFNSLNVAYEDWAVYSATTPQNITLAYRAIGRWKA